MNLTFDEIVDLARQADIADETKIRYKKIREEYEELKTSGKTATEAKEIIAQKWFLSTKSVDNIIYPITT
jgi:hypothetical protein